MNRHPIIPLLKRRIPKQITVLDRKGGPDEQDYTFAQGFSEVLAERGEQLFVFDKDEDNWKIASFAESMAYAIAVLAYQPGGVHVFGLHYDVSGYEEEKNDEPQNQTTP